MLFPQKALSLGTKEIDNFADVKENANGVKHPPGILGAPTLINYIVFLRPDLISNQNMAMCVF